MLRSGLRPPPSCSRCCALICRWHVQPVYARHGRLHARELHDADRRLDWGVWTGPSFYSFRAPCTAQPTAAAMHSGVQVVHVAHNVGKAVMRKTSLMQACPRCPQSEQNEDRLGCVLLGTEVVTAHIAQEPGDKAEPPAPPALERNDQQVSRPGGKADDLTMRSGSLLFSTHHSAPHTHAGAGAGPTLPAASLTYLVRYRLVGLNGTAAH